jgi:hypothetical protein
MTQHLIGSWKSERSSIPDYVAGREWLHFAPDGKHVIDEVMHPGEDSKSVKTEFTIEDREGAYRFSPTKKKPDGSSQNGWRVSIVRVDQEEIAVTPDLPKHGFTTVYRRVMKPEPNQSLQPTAPSRRG